MAATSLHIQRIHQNLMDCQSEPIKTLVVAEKALTAGYFSKFIPYEPLGIAPAYRSDGRLAAVAICNNGFAVVVELKASPRFEETREDLLPLQDLLLRNQGLFLAFDADLLAMALYRDLSMRVMGFVDIQSTFPQSIGTRHPIDAIEAGVNKDFPIFKNNIDTTFRRDIYDKENNNNTVDELVLRAWVAQRLYQVQGTESVFDQAIQINTTTEFIPTQQLDYLEKLNSVVHRLEQAKPYEQKHQIEATPGVHGESKMDVKSTKFSNRIRREGSHQHVQINFGNMRLNGQVAGVSGTKVTITNTVGEPKRGFGNRTALTVTTIGKDEPTRGEKARRKVLLAALQGRMKIFDENIWVQNLWSRSTADDITWPPEWPALLPLHEDCLEGLEKVMNPSQVRAIAHMSTQRITLVHGPPGTGKTTVIGKFVESWAQQETKPGIWLVAQSNVAVKNIAEKLFKLGFVNWKVLVSSEFIFEWHSHIYEDIRGYIITSDVMVAHPSTIKRMLEGCQVMLCTLSMLSSKQIRKFTSVVPMEALVVDEASQIDISDYLSVFTRFGDTLRKVCFIGDEKQLPPYGQETISNLQSAFELDILQTFSVLLNIQYRMPPQIGSFISAAVYEDKLNSNPDHTVKDGVIACQFINADGNERPSGTSFMNNREIEAILLLAQFMQDQEKSYKIITPYDAQRNEIERALKNSGLVWENKVFNVDSFQGNEEDYIIISIVRTQALGFLAKRRRSNVMLTRCKQGMYIVSKRAFIDKKCSESLVGELASAIEERIGVDDTWLTTQDLENGKFQIHKPLSMIV